MKRNSRIFAVLFPSVIFISVIFTVSLVSLCSGCNSESGESAKYEENQIAPAIENLQTAEDTAVPGKPGVIALCYHSFWGKPKFKTDFSMDELEEHIQYFTKNGFTFVSWGDIKNNRIKGNKNILITIDDGNISAFDAYIKVLKPRGIKPLFAIYPCVISNAKYAMKWENIISLANDGCEIAAHGYYHQLLFDKLFNKDPRAFKNEIFLSKKTLEKKLGKPVSVFAFPNGAYGPMAQKLVREAGYTHALTIDPGLIHAPLSSNADIFLLPRYLLSPQNWKGFKTMFLHPEKLKGKQMSK